MTAIPAENRAGEQPTGEHPAGDPAPAGIRASDAEREQTIARLHAAVGEGRLRLDEAEERVSTVYGMRFREQLPAVLADLPGDREQVHLSGDAPPGWRSIWESVVWHGMQTLQGRPVPRPAPRDSVAAARVVIAAVLLFVLSVVLGAGLVR
jgi:hypothetical protein